MSANSSFEEFRLQSHRMDWAGSPDAGVTFQSINKPETVVVRISLGDLNPRPFDFDLLAQNRTIRQLSVNQIPLFVVVLISGFRRKLHSRNPSHQHYKMGSSRLDTRFEPGAAG